ncbi:MAG: aminotransferase class I/II-fold pyridoxal phosphate-dependent enzyme, partial [Gammaproteobacteria bacterium]|nr:aminotransferase class I/II-fold pyridoxal phosphate-dependent enzyme [Gammaproteobacteria bacterium]
MLLPEFRLETYFSRWEFSAKYILCGSDIETLSLQELLALASDEDRERWDKLRLGYVETFGTPALRQAIAETYESISAGEVLAFAGAEEGLFAAMHAVLEPDDHAIVIVPNYQSAETLPASICAVTGIALAADDDWNLDLDELRAAIRPNTRLISINFPHNPTGKIIARDQFNELVGMAREHDLYLFSDEVYRLTERDPAKR